MARNLLLFLVNIIVIILSNGERTKDKMYESIEGTAACFRRLNATHQTGCTSKRPSSVGVIHVISDLEKDLKFVLHDGLASPYVIVLPINEFTPQLVENLSKYPSRLAGVLLHTNISHPEKMSHELACPNSGSSLQDSCPKETWNPMGTGLLHTDIPFPVFAIRNESELTKIETCFTKFNSWDYSEQPLRALCSLELAAFMFATRDSQTCIRRSASVTTFTPTRFCDPLGSRNAWATLWPRYNGTKRDIILVTARLDATSMFYDVTPGADAHLTGLVTLLATAYTLKQMVNLTEDYEKNIMFVLFNGEGYDYIGSQRFVYDIMNPKNPYNSPDIMNLVVENIKLVIELNQMNPNPYNQIFLHHIDVEQKQSNNEMGDFMTAFINEGKIYNINVTEVPASKNTLPPASLHSFLREKSSIQGAVLTDHFSKYRNQFYHSIYDDASNIDYRYYNSTDDGVIPEDSLQKRISDISKALAKVLYKQATGKSFTEEIKTNLEVQTVVDELLHCFLDTAYCKLFQALTHKDLLTETPLPSYVSVDTTSHKLTSLTGYTLAWLTADHTDIPKENCIADADHPSSYQYMWVSDNINDPTSTTCLRTTMHFSLALSPAFTIEDYDWKSNRYSTWTESVWSDVYMRMFLIPSRRHEVMTICVGTVTFVLSIALVYLVHKRADILFGQPEAITPGTSC